MLKGGKGDIVTVILRAQKYWTHTRIETAILYAVLIYQAGLKVM